MKTVERSRLGASCYPMQRSSSISWSSSRALKGDIVIGITVVGCYRPPSLQSLSGFLSRLNYSEIISAGDFNWDSLCDTLNLVQLINSSQI